MQQNVPLDRYLLKSRQQYFCFQLPLLLVWVNIQITKAPSGKPAFKKLPQGLVTTVRLMHVWDSVLPAISAGTANRIT
jgi:hypothetical protein